MFTKLAIERNGGLTKRAEATAPASATPKPLCEYQRLARSLKNSMPIRPQNLQRIIVQ